MPSGAASLRGGPGGFEIAERLSRAMGGDSVREPCFAGFGVRLNMNIPVTVAVPGAKRGPPAWKESKPSKVPLVYLRDPDPSRPEIREYIERSLLRRGLMVTDDLSAAVATLDSYDPNRREGLLPTVVLNEPREGHFAPLPVTSSMVDQAVKRVREIIGDGPGIPGRSFAAMRVLEVVADSWNWESSSPRALTLQGVFSRANIKRASSLYDALDRVLNDGPWDIVYIMCSTSEEGEGLAKAVRLAAERVPNTPMPLIVGAYAPPKAKDRLLKSPTLPVRSHLDRVSHHPLKPSFLRENLTIAVNRANLSASEKGAVKDRALQDIRLLIDTPDQEEEEEDEEQQKQDLVVPTNQVSPKLISPKFAPRMAVIPDEPED